MDFRSKIRQQLEIAKLWMSNPVRMYLDQRALKKAKIHTIEQNLVHQNEERVAQGFSAVPYKHIQENAKQIYKNRKLSRPSYDIVQTVQDLQRGRRIREEKESRERRKELRKGKEQKYDRDR